MANIIRPDVKTQTAEKSEADNQAGSCKRFCLGRVCGKALLSLALLVLLGAGLLVVRVSVAPMNLSFLIPVLENAMSNDARGYHVRLGSVRLGRSARGEILLRAQNVDILGDDGHQMMRVEKMALGAQWPYLFIGQFRPKVIVFEGPYLRVRRDKDAKFSLVGFGAGESSERIAGEARDQEKILRSMVAQLGGFGQGIAGEEAEGTNHLLSSLSRVEINAASVYVEDDFTSSVWTVPRFDTVFTAYEKGGLRANMDAYFQHGTMDRNSAHIQLIFSNATQQIEGQFILKQLASGYLQEPLLPLSDFGLRDHSVLLDGSIDAVLDYDFKVQHAALDLASSAGDLRFDLYDGQALPYEDLSIQARYGADKGLVIDGAKAKIADVSLVISGHVRPDEAAHVAGAYKGRLQLDIPSLRREDFVQLWPKAYQYVGAYEWLGDKLSGGMYENLIAQSGFHYVPGVALSQSAESEYTSGQEAVSSVDEGFKTGLVFDGVSVDFDFADMDIAFNSKMPAVQAAYGSGRFDYLAEYLRIDVKRALFDAFTVKNGVVELSHFVEPKHGLADVFVSLEGALPDVFGFLGRKPIGLGHGYDLDKVQGLASMRVNLQMPTFGDVQMDDVELDVRAHVDDGVIPAVFKDLDIEKARADVVIHDDRIRVSGSGQVLKQGVDFDYRSFIYSKGKPYKEKIAVRGLVDDVMRDRIGLDLSDLIEGSVGIDLAYVKGRDGGQSLDLEADLKPARVFVDVLGYEKPVGVDGYVSLNGRLIDGALRSISGMNVRAQGLRIGDGAIDFDSKTGALSRIRLPKLLVGKTRGAADIRYEKGGALQRLTADLDRLDARALLDPSRKDKKKKPVHGGSSRRGNAPEDKLGSDLIASISAKTMLTHEDLSVRDANVYLDMMRSGRMRQLELDGVAGAGSVYLRFKPQQGSGDRMFRFEADDAGATLAAFGLSQDIRGGSILVHGEPVTEGSPHFTGVAEIKDFRLVGAPVLAKILSLASLGGFTDGLANEGIEFKRLETKYGWTYMPQGSLLRLQDGRTSGAAIGLTFDGEIDQAAGVIDVSGTVVPVSQINRFIGSIPVVGEVLTGGTGIIAATYKVKGDPSDPDISINPLSVLAPGIIRRVLFE